jgi:hypothetical protein
MYRVNYGNGQVSGKQSLAACKREIAEMDLYKEFASVQRYVGDGMWVRV